MKIFLLYLWYFIATAAIFNGIYDIWKWIKMNKEWKELKRK